MQPTPIVRASVRTGRHRARCFCGIHKHTSARAQCYAGPRVQDVEIDLIGDRGGADVRLPIGPAEYLVELPNGTYRLGITDGDCIIGNTHMLKYWTVYDRVNMRMGFAPAIPEKCAAERMMMLAMQ